MKITDIRTKPLLLPLKQPYVWSQGVREAVPVILIEIETDDGLIGYGETMTAPNSEAVDSELRQVARSLIGASPFDVSDLCARAYQTMFKAFGASLPRHGALVVAGFEMALWDLMGKATGKPVHDLLGGPVHDHVTYFAFLQGETPDELAEDAARWVQTGTPVIYLKVWDAVRRSILRLSARSVRPSAMHASDSTRTSPGMS